MTKREWTQHDIAEAARRSHPAGHPGFFNTLQAQSRAAFGMPLECEVWRWEFPMGPLTVGQVLDFFSSSINGGPSNGTGHQWGRSPISEQTTTRQRKPSELG